MASTINAQTTPFAAVVTTADDTGNLALQTANVTALTINTAGAIGVGSSPSYGSSGQFLQSAGNAAPATWATVTQTRISGGTTGLTPSSLTSGDVTLAGTLAVANGGTGNTNGTAAGVSSGSWAITVSGTKIYFAYGGVNKGSLDSSGNFIVTGNVTAYGTP